MRLACSVCPTRGGWHRKVLFAYEPFTGSHQSFPGEGRQFCENSPDLLCDSSVDGARGNWECSLSRLAAGVTPTVGAMSASFEARILPLPTVPDTHTKAWWY